MRAVGVLASVSHGESARAGVLELAEKLKTDLAREINRAEDGHVQVLVGELVAVDALSASSIAVGYWKEG